MNTEKVSFTIKVEVDGIEAFLDVSPISEESTYGPTTSCLTISRPNCCKNYARDFPEGSRETMTIEKNGVIAPFFKS